MSEDHWLTVARHMPLGILCDLDGTIIPFADTPDAARPDADVVALVDAIASLPGVTFAIVSGRPKEALERMFRSQAVFLVAEHGAFRRGTGAWEAVMEFDASPLEEVAARLQALALRHPGALVERKTWTIALHYRGVRPRRREDFVVEAYAIIDDFLMKHPAFDRIEGVLVTEVRPATVRKSMAVPWVRERAGPGARLVAIGDDVTDEHMFAALDARDDAILVRHRTPRRTAARWELEGPNDVLGWLGFVRSVREGRTLEGAVYPRLVFQPTASEESATHALLVVSNRLPDSTVRPGEDARKRNVGGLISALEPALRARGGLWLGWGGATVPDDGPVGTGATDDTSPKLVWIDYKESWYRDYYTSFCNGTLWPLFHSFASRVTISDRSWDRFVEVHDAFADIAVRHVAPTGMVWVHDYHMLLFARAMRERGHVGPMGHFLHIPFPPLDIFEMLPWAPAVLDGMLQFDLLGFHTPGHIANFMRCVGALSSAQVADDVVVHRGRRTRVAPFPIGILPAAFQEPPDASTAEEVYALMRALGASRLVLGVDRLDYTKGIPERLLAFERLLQLSPEWRRKVSLVQISVPSRADVPLYAEQRALVESIVGRINGEYGEASWVPIRYLYRSYERGQLAQLYRAAHVGYVTPLRDGMNLVAKEYVAAQDPENPGALLLSRFAGAAVEMTDAVLTNPYHTDGMARDLDRALRMGLEERRMRHARLLGVVTRTDAATWAESFLAALAACR